MRIRQSGVFLNALVKDVLAGRLLPAAFQRPYVWTREDVLKLVSSIVKGYPLGGFLLWSPHQHADLTRIRKPRLGPLTPAEDASTISLLLDGQNRLATLAWLGWDQSSALPETTSDHERSLFAGPERLVVDLANRRITFVPVAEAWAGVRLPANALLDSRVANQLIRKAWQSRWASTPETELEECLRWFDRTQSSFQEARVVATEMEGATVDEAKDAFMHICKVGVPMSEEDFSSALKWALE